MFLFRLHCHDGQHHTHSAAVDVAFSAVPFYVRAKDAAGNLSIASDFVNVNPPTPPANPPACQVTYTTTTQWARGFVAGVTVANTGPTPVAGWTLAFSFGDDQRITSAWNATASQSGAAVTMKNADWNAVIPAGSSTSVGMQGTWTAGNTPPTAFSLNGVPCRVG